MAIAERAQWAHSRQRLAVIPWAGRVTDAIDGTAMEVDYLRIYQGKP